MEIKFQAWRRFASGGRMMTVCTSCHAIDAIFSPHRRITAAARPLERFRAEEHAGDVGRQSRRRGDPRDLALRPRGRAAAISPRLGHVRRLRHGLNRLAVPRTQERPHVEGRRLRREAPYVTDLLAYLQTPQHRMLDARPQRVARVCRVQRLRKRRHELVSGGVERDAVDALYGNAADAAAEEHDLPRIQDHF